MWGSACARIFEGSAGGSLPRRMFAPMRKSSATGAFAASSVVVSPFAAVIERGGRTRLLSRLSNISAPDDKRWSGRLRRLGGSFARSTGGITTGCVCWATAIDPSNKSNNARKKSFNIETLAMPRGYNNVGEELLRDSAHRIAPADAQSPLD